MARESATHGGCTYPRGFPQGHAWPWPLIPARELVSLQYGRALTASDRVPDGVPVYGTNGQCGWHNKPLANGPGIILGRKGQGPLGVEWCSANFWVIDTAYYISLLRPDVHLAFLYHLIKYIGLNHLKDGTSNPTLSRDSFGSQLLPLPPPPEQKRIAHILGTLDDKIDLNRRMNATLEGISRAIFKSWFVDFDPVRQKAAGKQPVGMDAQTAALFPDSFEDSEIGEVPKGWGAKSIYEAADVIYGAPFASTMFNGSREGMPLIRIRDLPTESPDVFTPEKHPKAYLVQPGDIIVGMDGEFRAYVWGGSPGWLNQRVCVFKPKPPFFPSFVREAIVEPLRQVEATETATTVIHLGKGDIDRFRFICPSAVVVAVFSKVCQPLYDAIVANRRQSRSLAGLRDTLLPKLLSGELRVPEAEGMVEEAVG